MQTFVARIKMLCQYLRQYLWIAIIVYVIHLTIEGFAVNVAYYKVIKPLWMLI